MSVAALIARLDGVRQSGTDRWAARCPAHDDRRASLSVRELEDGRVLVHDFAGCAVEAVLDAVGLGFDALYPERTIGHARRERRPFPAADVLRAVQFEALIAAVGACNLAEGVALSEADRERLMLAAERLQAAGVLRE